MPDTTLNGLTAKTAGAAALLYGAVSPYANGNDCKVSLTAAGASMIEAASATAQQTLLGITGGGTIATGGFTFTIGATGTAALLGTANVFTSEQSFNSTTIAGLRLNNLTTTQRDAISSPLAGMAVWNTTTTRLNLHDGSAWTSGFVRLVGDALTGALSVNVGTNSPTPATALQLINSTAATVGVQSASGALTFEGFGWKTTATAASQSVKFQIFNLPVQGTTNPSGTLTFQSSINGAAYSTLMSVTSAGVFTVGSLSVDTSGNMQASSTNSFLRAGGRGYCTGSTAYTTSLSDSGPVNSSTAQFLFTDGTCYGGTIDTGLSRLAAGIVGATTGGATAGTFSGKWKTIAAAESTGAGTPLLGSNCPASTLTAPYKWQTITTSDGSTGYMPIWK